MPDVSMVERAWYGHGAGNALVRTALLPAEGVYRAVVGVRNAMYRHGVLRVHRASVPVLSIGNLSSGGTGKTPVAAWYARHLADAGASPAIVMRGYGDDEPLVHRRLNPDVPVVTNPDRVAGARRAVEEGADCIVLDDAFQHRRLARAADVVLVSADRWDGRNRLLPAGPWREPLGALARASVVLVTRKAASAERAAEVARQLEQRGAARVAVAALELGPLREGEGTAAMGLDRLSGRAVLAVSAVGDARAFHRQLEAAGARVRPAVFPDHHRFTEQEIQALSRDARADEIVVCTLKDHVKLAPLWPRATGALWYVSQRVVPESGESAVHGALDAVLHARNS